MNRELKTEEVVGIGIGCIGLVIIFAATVIVASVYFGWAVSLLWGWFLVPLGLPKISLIHAVGLMQLANVVLRPIHGSTGKDFWVGLLVGPAFAVLIGFIIKSYM